jgi:hypothetical protein
VAGDLILSVAVRDKYRTLSLRACPLRQKRLQIRNQDFLRTETRDGHQSHKVVDTRDPQSWIQRNFHHKATRFCLVTLQCFFRWWKNTKQYPSFNLKPKDTAVVTLQLQRHLQKPLALMHINISREQEWSLNWCIENHLFPKPTCSINHSEIYVCLDRLAQQIIYMGAIVWIIHAWTSLSV